MSATDASNGHGEHNEWGVQDACGEWSAEDSQRTSDYESTDVICEDEAEDADDMEIRPLPVRGRERGGGVRQEKAVSRVGRHSKGPSGEKAGKQPSWSVEEMLKLAQAKRDQQAHFEGMPHNYERMRNREWNLQDLQKRLLEVGVDRTTNDIGKKRDNLFQQYKKVQRYQNASGGKNFFNLAPVLRTEEGFNFRMEERVYDEIDAMSKGNKTIYPDNVADTSAVEDCRCHVPHPLLENPSSGVMGVMGTTTTEGRRRSPGSAQIRGEGIAGFDRWEVDLLSIVGSKVVLKSPIIMAGASSRMCWCRLVVARTSVVVPAAAGAPVGVASIADVAIVGACAGGVVAAVSFSIGVVVGDIVLVGLAVGGGIVRHVPSAAWPVAVEVAGFVASFGASCGVVFGACPVFPDVGFVHVVPAAVVHGGPSVSLTPTRPFPYNKERTRVCEWDVREVVARIGGRYYFPLENRCSGFVDADFVIVDTLFPPYSVLLPFNELIVIPWMAVAPHWPRTLCTECQRFDRYEQKGFHYLIRSEDEHKERATRLRPSTSDSELTNERRRDLIRKRDTRSIPKSFRSKRRVMENLLCIVRFNQWIVGIKLDQSSTRELNLTVLQRIDHEVEEILTTAGHVTLYEFDVEEKSWSRKDVEGALFVVKRRAQPRFQFIVMNRRSTANLVEDLLGDFEFEVQIPYLLYRNAQQEVNGIWFFNQKECEQVSKLLERILYAFAKAPPPSRPRPFVVPTGGGGAAAEAQGPDSAVPGPTTGPAPVPAVSSPVRAADPNTDPAIEKSDGSIVSAVFKKPPPLEAREEDSLQKLFRNVSVQSKPSDSSAVMMSLLTPAGMTGTSSSDARISLSSSMPPLPLPTPLCSSSIASTTSSILPPPRHVLPIEDNRFRLLKPSYFVSSSLSSSSAHTNSMALSCSRLHGPLLNPVPVSGPAGPVGSIPNVIPAPLSPPLPPPLLPPHIGGGTLPNPNHHPITITKDRIRTAMYRLLHDDRFIDMIYRGEGGSGGGGGGGGGGVGGGQTEEEEELLLDARHVDVNSKLMVMSSESLSSASFPFPLSVAGMEVMDICGGEWIVGFGGTG
ncbi:hypothetical protein CBR_g19774 [Chara braunii]|uniref:WH1 domain-containing protein n=1 Tax=Chara braunii TaxID=69332 RepID=A0A388JU55_CHABU|nr:hypothetical protein CBR_g19774 [Chara braunii]|eukprot:GBG61242.1 hypothetical protein CBR_g19774 [Chara braunii]